MRVWTKVALMLLLVWATWPISANGSGELHGFAAHYRVGVMERAATVHGLSRVSCMVASSYYPLGTWLRVASGATRQVAICRVSDITARRDVPTVRRRGIVIEFGAANIKRMCGLDRVGQEPPRACPVVVSLAGRT